jgi:hypothetical protein
MLASPFESRVGPFGAFVTRINYVIYLEDVMAVNGIDRSPKLENIEVSVFHVVFFRELKIFFLFVLRNQFNNQMLI